MFWCIDRAALFTVFLCVAALGVAALGIAALGVAALGGTSASQRVP